MATGFMHLLDLSDDELGSCDLVALNLLVARSIPSLAHLNIRKYQRQADEWASDIRDRLREYEPEFHRTPGDWGNDIRIFRLGVLCGYLEHEQGIAYIEEHRYAQSVWYTNPSQLFLDGVMDTRRGSCANMAMLHVALGRRLGWPVSLAAVKSHFVCRVEDGRTPLNVEATQSGHGGFKIDPDEYVIRKSKLPRIAVTSGSDLRSMTVREMLGTFVGLRGRHMRDTGRAEEAEGDYLLARRLFPTNRKLYEMAMILSETRGTTLFAAGEEFHVTPRMINERIARTVFAPPSPPVASMREVLPPAAGGVWVGHGM